MASESPESGEAPHGPSSESDRRRMVLPPGRTEGQLNLQIREPRGLGWLNWLRSTEEAPPDLQGVSAKSDARSEPDGLKTGLLHRTEENRNLQERPAKERDWLKIGFSPRSGEDLPADLRNRLGEQKTSAPNFKQKESDLPLRQKKVGVPRSHNILLRPYIPMPPQGLLQENLKQPARSLKDWDLMKLKSGPARPNISPVNMHRGPRMKGTMGKCFESMNWSSEGDLPLDLSPRSAADEGGVLLPYAIEYVPDHETESEDEGEVDLPDPIEHVPDHETESEDEGEVDLPDPIEHVSDHETKSEDADTNPVEKEYSDDIKSIYESLVKSGNTVKNLSLASASGPIGENADRSLVLVEVYNSLLETNSRLKKWLPSGSLGGDIQDIKDLKMRMANSNQDITEFLKSEGKVDKIVEVMNALGVGSDAAVHTLQSSAPVLHRIIN